MLSLGLSSAVALGQPARPAVPSSAAAATKPALSASRPLASRPLWTDLTPMQQQTLQPLAGSWANMSEAQKRKWLKISRSYPSLPPEGQATMHSRMNEWVALSPQQRAEARLNFAKTTELARQLTPEEKKAKWLSYQALSPEEKQSLAAKAARKPAGAAPVVKPPLRQKLAAVPLPSGQAPPVSPKPAASPPAPAFRPALDGGSASAAPKTLILP